MNDLSAKEQEHVRAALRFLRTRCGSYETLSKALGFGKGTASNIVGGRVVTPLVAFRVARFAKVGVDDVLTGRFPDPRCCPHCGHIRHVEEAAQ